MKLIVFALVVLTFVVLALTVGLWIMARQIGILFERISPMGALVNDSGPEVGQSTPEFNLPSLTGGRAVIGPKSIRSTLVFFLSPTCPICKKLLPILDSVRKAEGGWLDVILASDGEDAQHARFIENARLSSYPYVVSAELGLAYRVARLPYAVLFDEHGVIRAKGLINSREQFDSLFNAFEMKVGSIQTYLDDRMAVQS
ncbi:methylamine dehydrogenase accessory protein MauD [Acidomonas methanolica]|uniref:methylamine dehydrogenase accessory protein MauD n=1 Tax=Acidomonas methanolica TaxID=437 RepID=UPI00211A2750|nr:methylamine dehydrogenase accessory protein MauD [Acidomonas methanolica]MCQ9156528.1 methylamine dehydrogenase accessory protein MauD [Acidomonas methanolica]